MTNTQKLDILLESIIRLNSTMTECVKHNPGAKLTEPYQGMEVRLEALKYYYEHVVDRPE